MIEKKLINDLNIEGFFDEETSTISYVVYDNKSKKCAIIDSVLDFDFSSGTIDYHNADKIISYVKKEKLDVEWLIETHVHADHLSASPYIQKKIGGKIYADTKTKLAHHGGNAYIGNIDNFLENLKSKNFVKVVDDIKKI